MEENRKVIGIVEEYYKVINRVYDDIGDWYNEIGKFNTLEEAKKFAQEKFDEIVKSEKKNRERYEWYGVNPVEIVIRKVKIERVEINEMHEGFVSKFEEKIDEE